MFGLIFIIIGVLVLLQYYGVVGAFSGLVWGIIFIAAGLLIFARRMARRRRRTEWMARREQNQNGPSGNDKRP
ncbi:MAG TPA: hypothetical protein VHZ04_03490 [Candidatus Paceibacterota bacterium]|jgi:uncharacterized membrane protein YbaN (DUF454 family)|nr:hypothetical protein [Candidatus Paceibacterota bacterium]